MAIMASITKLNGNGTKYRVSYRIGTQVRNRTARNFIDACHLFWLCECETFSQILPSNLEKRVPPTIKTALIFYIGQLVERHENDDVSGETVKRYVSCYNGLPDELLSTRIDKFTQCFYYHKTPPSTKPFLVAALRYTANTLNWTFHNIYHVTPINRKSIKIPSRDAVNRLIAQCNSARERIFFYLAAVCGLRISEIMALTWDKITQTGFVVDQHISNGTVIDGHKSGRIRTIDCDNTFFALISDLNPNARYLIENTAHPDRFLSWSAFWKRFIGPIFKLIKASFTPHCLRHYAISQCISMGWDILKVQNFAGHKSVRTTLETYGHLINKAPPVVNTFAFRG